MLQSSCVMSKFKLKKKERAAGGVGPPASETSRDRKFRTEQREPFSNFHQSKAVNRTRVQKIK